jgi:hypothetical protein
MEKLFLWSYRLSDQDLDRLWQEATGAFDANVLLHVYRYSPQAREQLFDAAERVKPLVVRDPRDNCP